MRLITRSKSKIAPDLGVRKKRRRPLRAVGIVGLVILGLILASTAINLILEPAEKSSIKPYGERVTVSGGALNVYRNGNGVQPIVLLSGLGTPAPGLDFAPLVRELDGFDVMVVEGFGYGYSDMEAGPRTNENISNELHEALAKLQVRQPYILAGHSIAGFYLLDYANRYPAEVSAVIEIDASIPKPGSDPVPEPEAGFNWGRALSVTGLVRTVAWLAPDLVNPDSDAYTEDELQRMRLMGSWNFGNAAVADETARIANNAAALRGVTYPDDMPVLAFLADDKSGSLDTKMASTQNLLKNVERQEIVTLEGGHYLHWTQAKPMADAIRAFLFRGD
jgi:pimeloyl-ACP methyl ester carboxylesterase